MNTCAEDNILLYGEPSQREIYKLLSEMISEVRNLNIAVDFLRTEILNAKPQASDAKTTSSVIGFSVSQASEISDRRNRTYTFDEPVTFTPLSPPPRRKPVTHVRSMATLSSHSGTPGF